MHPSSTTTSTPFSVKDILKLEQQHDFDNEFLVTDQVVPMHHQHVNPASRSGDSYHCQPEQFGSGMQKLDSHSSAAEEEMNEQGEMTHTRTHTHTVHMHHDQGRLFLCQRCQAV